MENTQNQTKKRVYTFGNGAAEGRADMKDLLGGKGANLAEMNLIGLPVPPGFTITTKVCIEYYKLGKKRIVELLKPEVEGWKLLFDGKTLNGWRDYNGDSLTAPWTVEDGTIRALGGGSDASGYIVTDEIYENFELVWDWKIAEGGNSGVLYHVVEHPKFNVPYITGPEYQLIDEEN
jgi:hypothetical protein